MQNDTNARQCNDIDLAGLSRMVAGIEVDAKEAAAEFSVSTRWTGQTRSETMVEGFKLGGQFIKRAFKIVADEPNQLLGVNSAPNPQELLMAALNACMMVGYVANASLAGITIDQLEIETKGELDLRGFLGLDPMMPAGYREMDVVVRVSADGTEQQMADILEAVMRTSPNVFNLANPIAIRAKLEVN